MSRAIGEGPNLFNPCGIRPGGSTRNASCRRIQCFLALDPVGGQLPAFAGAWIGRADTEHGELFAARREEDDVDGVRGTSTRRARGLRWGGWGLVAHDCANK